MQYGHVTTSITVDNQTTIQALAVSPDTQITALRHLIARGKIKSKPLLAQTERITTANSIELTLWLAQGSGTWQELFSLWMPNVEAFARVDVISELGCAQNEPFILAPGFKLGVSAARLTGSTPNDDRVMIFGDWYQDTQELIYLL
jgi:hypothetical protein